MPILGGMLIKTEKGFVTATLTDLDITTQCRVPASVVENDLICLPARQISDIVRHLTDEVISIETLPENNCAKILYGESEINIYGLPPEQFPEIPAPGGQQFFQVKKKTFKEMIRQTIFAVSTDRTRPLFTGVFFEISNQKLRLVATDTHRLALTETSLEVSTPASNIIVPSSALNELNRILQSDEENMLIEIGLSHVFFSTEDTVLSTRLIAGQFPLYNQIIPTKYVSQLQAGVRETYDAVRRAALLPLEEIPVIHFSLSTQQCILFLNTSAGWIREKINANYQGEPLEVFFNARYLMDCLHIIPTEDFSIDFTGPLSAAVIRPSEKDNFLSLLLPARPREEKKL
jgi:DNA polymerase-3 subunit beta